MGLQIGRRPSFFFSKNTLNRGRHWGIRKADHQGYIRRGMVGKSGVANHALRMLHQPDWENSCLVAKDRRTYKRRIMQSILLVTQARPQEVMMICQGP
mmetsp:Transcript_41737/g.61515  ORF Transcript_41737/g.61515 Transcript_41737/m.61515 type:complete len:98 (-) Transcript_41737:401-694(-)